MNRVLAPPPRIASRHRTPDAFEMFKVHQSGVVVAFDPVSPEVSAGDDNILLVSASTTEADDHSIVRLSLVNTSPGRTVKLSLKLAQLTPTSIAGRVLTAPPLPAPHRSLHRSPNPPMGATAPPVPAVFHGATLQGRTVAIAVPARSVVVLMVR